MGRRNRGNNIPDGWQGCPSMGTGFVDDRFFVFKTPLKADLNDKVPQSDRFSIENIFQRTQQMNNSRIGLWIDLTNTARYYNPEQILNRGVEYQKLACEGHGRPPSRKTISAFCYMVHNFFRRNRHDYVGVHCTHGFNRTGYLICCYLIRYRKYTAAEAVHEFSIHRHPGIYRQIYVNDLYTMSVPLESPIQVSEPQWLVQQRNPQNHRQGPAVEGMASSSSSSGQDISGNEVQVYTSPRTGFADYKVPHNETHPIALLPTPSPVTANVPIELPSTSLPAIQLLSSS